MDYLQKEYKAIKKELDISLSGVFYDASYILGKRLKGFEEYFATYLQTGYCIGVGNGLEAIQIALTALGIGPGDEVITVSNSFIATALAISHVGATPVFVDVNEDFLMDINKIEEAITFRTKAIMPVHLFGLCANMSAITKIAQNHNLKVIEDAAQAHGSEYAGEKAGSMGDIACFSFYPTKNLACYGDGGAIVTRSEKLAEQCRKLRNYGRVGTSYTYDLKGYNSRLDEIQAAILTLKLHKLDEWNMKRNIFARMYTERLQKVQGIISTPSTDNNPSTHVFHQYVIRVENRDKLISFMKQNYVDLAIHYPTPIHMQDCYADTFAKVLPNTEKFATEIVSLPMHHFMDEQTVDKVCTLIERFYQKELHYHI